MDELLCVSEWISAQRALLSALDPASIGLAERQQIAIYDYVQQVLLSELARIAVEGNFETREAALGVRDAICSMLEEQAENSVSDTTYQAIEGLRSEVARALPDVALPSMALREVSTTVPALLLAYELREDASKDEDLIRRNGVRHPLFCLPGMYSFIPGT